MEESREERVDTRLLPRLTRNNWNSEFRDAFKEYALTCGEAGEIVISGVNVILARPERNMLGPPDADGQRALMFDNNERGDRNYDKHEKRYNALKAGKKKMLFSLLAAMDKEVKNALTTTEGYQQLYDTFDILGIWNMTEQTVMGRGAISVYTVVVRLLKCMQNDGYTMYEKEFKELVVDLRAQGNADQILTCIFNALFIMGLNQEQFKDRLTQIYGLRDWPDYVQLSGELHTYAEATDRMQELRKDNNDGKIMANVAKSSEEAIAAAKTNTRVCWNCGSSSHMGFECKQPRHKCTRCGRRGHLEKFCRGEATTSEKRDESRDSKRYERREPQERRREPTKRGDRDVRGERDTRSDRDERGDKSIRSRGPSKSAKMGSRTRVLRKVLASLITADEDEDENEESEEERDDYSEDEEGDSVEGYVTTCVVCPREQSTSYIHRDPNLPQVKDGTAMSTQSDGPLRGSRRYVIDSACRGAHVLQSADVLESQIDTSKWRRMPYVHGVTGHKIETTAAGSLAHVDGVALVTPRAGSNLLSLMEMVKSNGGSFSGDSHHLVVRDGSGNVLLEGVNNGDDFWSCDEAALAPSFSALEGDVEMPLVSEDAVKQFVETPSNTLQTVDAEGRPIIDLTGQALEPRTHLTAEERARAKEAHALCDRMGHPGDQAVIDSLDYSLRPEFAHLTSQDFRNGRALLGPCRACQEGKMTAPRELVSKSEPARSIGEHVHSDLYILKDTSIGGNRFILVTADEKSSYIVGVPMQRKSESHVRDAGIQTLTEFNVHGHRMVLQTTDDESSLLTLKKHLGPLGVRVSPTPAGLHEKFVEKRIGTIKDRKRAILAALPYELPAALECEAVMYAISCINRVPNKTTGPTTTPHTLFTGSKPFLSKYHFGQFGLFYNKRKEEEKRSEWGIFIGHGSHSKYLRCYNPLTKTVTSKRRFVPQTAYPTAWGLKPRLRAPDRTPYIPTPSLPLTHTQSTSSTQPNTLVQSGALTPPLSPPTDAASDVSHDAFPTHGLPVHRSAVASTRPSRGLEGTSSSSTSGSMGVPHTATRSESIITPSGPDYGYDDASSRLHVDSSPVPPVPDKTNSSPTRHNPRLNRHASYRKAHYPQPRGSSPKGSRTFTRPRQEGASSSRTRQEGAGITQEGAGSVLYSQEGDGQSPTASSTMTSTVPESSSPATVPSASQRPRRVTAGSWLDGPSTDRGGDFQTARQTKRRVQAELSLVNAMNDPHGPFKVSAMRTSLKTALKNKERRGPIQKSIEAEIDNLEQPGVLKAIDFEDIPAEHKKHIIGVYMFHKEKFKADGTFDKDKCRIVLLSNRRDIETIGDSESPTVNPISVMTQLNLASVNANTVLAAYDIKGAFLTTPMQPGVRMFIRVNPDVAEHWIKRHPERIDDLHSDGCLYFELQRYVYGLHEASHEFNSALDKALREEGFTPTRADRCLYVKKTEDGMLILSVHVDDMLLTCPSVKWREWFETRIETRYALVKQYDNVSYLGMQIHRDRKTGDILVDQHGFLQSLLLKHRCDSLRRAPSTPATERLTEHDPNSPAANTSEYLSLVMSLMYLARFTRPDINFVVSYLATKSSCATEEDFGKLHRVLHYLSGTQHHGLRFVSAAPFRPCIHADASHHLYPTGHGQMGMVISNGSAPVGHRSVKIRMITRSSSESELCALEDASTYAVWYNLLLSDLGFDFIKPLTIYQDNKSTIIMAIQGATFKRTKHLIGRQSFVRERIHDGEISLKYLGTKYMLADLLTKSVSKVTLDRLRDALHIYTVAKP